MYSGNENFLLLFLVCPFSIYLFIGSLSRQLPSAGCNIGTVLDKVCFSPHSFSSSCWEKKLDVRIKALGTKGPKSRRKAIASSLLLFWHLGGLLFVHRLETGGLRGNSPLSLLSFIVTTIHVSRYWTFPSSWTVLLGSGVPGSVRVGSQVDQYPI